MSTMTAPGRIADSMSRVTSFGALAPGTRTAPITRSASVTSRSIASPLLATVRIRPRWIWSIYLSRSTFLSRTRTSASMPAAIHAAFRPAMPPPRTTTLAGSTPEAPPINTPLPPYTRSRYVAPTCGAIRPAISLIGASSGSRPSSSSTVSYATAATFRCTRNSVSPLSAARCRYVKSSCPSRKRSYSCGCGSLTLTIMSAASNTASASDRIFAPALSKSSSGSAEPTPAPASTTTSCPARVSSRTPSGVCATRYSLSLTSFGIPTITVVLLGAPAPAPATQAYPTPPALRRRSVRAGDRASPARSTRLGDERRERRLRVADATGARPRGEPVEGLAEDLDPVLGLAVRLALDLRHEEVDVLVREAGGRVDAAEELDRAVSVPRLLEKLARRDGDRVLAVDVEIGRASCRERV